MPKRVGMDCQMPMDRFEIDGRPVGGGESRLIVGEVAQVHDSSLGAAHLLIDSIADAGADAVKFRTHIPAAESAAAEGPPPAASGFPTDHSKKIERCSFVSADPFQAHY